MASIIITPTGESLSFNDLKYDHHGYFIIHKLYKEISTNVNNRLIELFLLHNEKEKMSSAIRTRKGEDRIIAFWGSLDFERFYCYSSLCGYLCCNVFPDEEMFVMRINGYDCILDSQIERLVRITQNVGEVDVDFYGYKGENTYYDELTYEMFIEKL